VSTPAFVDRAADALVQPKLRAVVSREITVQLLEPALPDAVAARPVIQSTLSAALGSSQFQPLFRLGATHAHRLLFGRGGNAVFDIADAGAVVTSALKTIAPKIAAQIPKNTDSVLLTLRRRGFADTTLRVADAIRVVGFVLPFVALALFALAIWVARDKRRAITRSAIGLGVTAVVFAIALELLRRYATDHVTGTLELSSKDVHGAVDELWGAFFDDLTTWTLAFAAAAWLVVAASSAVLAPYSAATVLQRLRAFLQKPRSPRFRTVQGVVVMVIGVFVVVRPTLSLRVVAVVSGLLLIYFGLGELLTVTAPAEPRARHRPVPSRRLAIGFGGASAALIAGLIVAIVLTGATPTQARSAATCNGYRQLCDRRLDEVAFAGTHNSMSAADSRGWFIANQDRGIAEQLRDGIRAFKISTHYATEDPSGWVHTDIAAEGKRLNRVASRLVPSARAALQRLSTSLGRFPDVGKRDIWLCHTLCELGATQMVAFLQTIREFLELNPNQVMVFFDEDYVKEKDLRSAFVRAGLFRYLAQLRPGQPLPTLRQLIRSHHNIVVFAQDRTSGKYPWNQYAFNWMEDTPLGAVKPSQFTCKLNRGQAGNPILLMNNWADIFPPRPSPNIPVVQRDFILSRAQQCVSARGRYPNVILTDYYNRGNVVGAVDYLNGVEGKRPAKTIPVKGA
jgi:hypothetical protein